MSFIVREDFLKRGEQAPKLVPADSYDKMMANENYLNANTSEVEYIPDWNHHRWEEENKEALDSLHTKFDHWKVKGLGARPIIQDNFFAAAGKGKQCKAAGLTGAEKRACKKNIKTTCGHKPLFGKAKKASWLTCSSGAIVTPEQAAQDAAEKLVPTSEDKGLSTGAKVMLAVAIVGTLALITVAIIRSKKTAAVAPALNPIKK